MKIGYLTKAKDACWFSRVMLPMSQLAVMGHEVKDDLLELATVCQICKKGGIQERNLYDLGEWKCGYCRASFNSEVDVWKERVKSLIKWADIVVIQRVTSEPHLRLLKEIKEIKKPVVLECDDNYIEVPEWNTGYSYYKKNQPFIREMLKLADAITVTTESLKKRYSEFNSNIFVLQNCLDIEMIDVTPPAPEFAIYDLRRKQGPVISMAEFAEIRKDKKIVGWGGSPTHEKDLELVIEPLKKICKKYPEVIVLMVGYVHRRMLEEMPPNQLYCVGLVPVSFYFSLYKALKMDVGIAPVVENEFNAAKSQNKVTEYQVLGSLPVASNYVTYDWAIGKGFLVDHNDPYKWFVEIRRALFCEDREERIAFNRKYAEENFDIKHKAVLWEQAYKNILENFK